MRAYSTLPMTSSFQALAELVKGNQLEQLEVRSSDGQAYQNKTWPLHAVGDRHEDGEPQTA